MTASFLPLVGILLLVYLLSGIIAHFVAPSLIFPRFPSSYTAGEYTLILQTDAGFNIPASFFPNPDAELTLLYSHGNGEDLGDIQPTLKNFAKRGFQVMAYEYPGYGLGDGKATVRNTFAAAEAAYRYLTQDQGIDPRTILLYGRSLGSGPSHFLARNFPIGGLILDGAFVSTYRVMTHFSVVPGDKFQNLRRIRRLDVPVLVIHGMQDEIVPFWHGEALYRAAPEPKRHLWVEDAGHNDLEEVAGSDYWDAIKSFTELLNP